MSKKKVTPSAQAAAFEKGNILCPSCGKTVSRIGTMPFTEVPCEKCGMKIFVPGKLDHYFLYELLGHGGMGSVYRAFSEKNPQETVAVKILSRSAGENPSNILALLTESRIASNFTGSDFVAGSLGHGYADGEYYIVSPCIEGERLDRRIARMEKLAPAEMLAVARHILAAEQYIYRRGYLFRDLKPENVIINPYGYAVLLDFGLCKSVSEAANPDSTAYVAGSPYYIPPERLMNEPENAASEIYSLGMVMYFGLTGRNYYNADEIDSLAKRHISGLRLSSAGKMQGIPKQIAKLLDDMIRQENRERLQTFQEVDARICDLQKEF
ncbi:MAG: serine/threonine protein kinase [Victivallales bacterium]|nr:serine/threonine protein kinase [Victivallales bacterium]